MGRWKGTRHFQILGWPISADDFCHKLVWEKTQELMGQPNIFSTYVPHYLVLPPTTAGGGGGGTDLLSDMFIVLMTIVICFAR